ncbi:MAG: nuclear transport factor 2 family protein [Polyangiaceae bacterium]
MADGDREEALIRAYFDVMRDGKIERLPGLLTDDCADRNPIRGQLPGRYGVAQKVLLFRAEHPDAQIVIESIEVAPPGAIATWATTAKGLDGSDQVMTWRFRGVFEFADGKLKSSTVARIG